MWSCHGGLGNERLLKPLMATMHIYDKNLQKSSSIKSDGRYMHHRVLVSNANPSLNFELYMKGSYLLPNDFVIKEVLPIYFLET